MNRNHFFYAMSINRQTGTKYPKLSIMFALLLIYLAPFTSSLLSYIAFVICMYRVIRYDARVFATDYCLLLPLSRIFCASNGFALLVWLCLFAGAWNVILRGIRANAAFVFLLGMLNYLILRMQMDIGNFVMCFGNLFVLCVLLPLQDSESAARAAKWFSAGLIVSSVYAILLRNTWQIRAVRGPESEAIWGTGIMRFMGLVPDPNYYMVMVIIALALLIKLKDCGRLKALHFWIIGIVLTVFGALSYSKTFLLMFVLLGGIYIIWQFWNKKIFSAMFLSIAAVAAASFLLFSDASPVAVIVDRLLGAKSLSDLTTGRTDIYLAYWRAINSDVATFFFGRGMAANRLFKDPHNIYLEIMYHTGVVGLLLFAGFYLSMVWVLTRQAPEIRKQQFVAKYIVLLMVLILFISLNGMFQVDFYGDFYVAFLSVMITNKLPESHTVKT